LQHTEEKPVTIIVGKTCDRCKVRIEADDVTAFQEMLSISFTCGYGSILGDGSAYAVDLCEPCVRDTLGEYIRKTN
jgi:hypothetical protein